MEDEQEDVRKMTDFINNQKATYQSNFQLEFQDFINFKHDISDQEFDEEQLDEEDELNSHDNEVKSYNNEEGPIPVSSLTEEERNVIESYEQEDVRKMTDFINNQKATYQSNFQLEFQDFINFKHDISDQEFDEEQLDEEDELNSHDNEVKSYNNEEGPIPVSSLTEEERNVIESYLSFNKIINLNRKRLRLHVLPNQVLCIIYAEILKMWLTMKIWTTYKNSMLY
ncbi:hypothetical protein MTP99_007803 [Tenebrio molitor]|nr:hypothetical protein MTP99_007803 [Tenebrio molitor]